jgi:hypothetical protein
MKYVVIHICPNIFQPILAILSGTIETTAKLQEPLHCWLLLRVMYFVMHIPGCVNFSSKHGQDWQKQTDFQAKEIQVGF